MSTNTISSSTSSNHSTAATAQVPIRTLPSVTAVTNSSQMINGSSTSSSPQELSASSSHQQHPMLASSTTTTTTTTTSQQAITHKNNSESWLVDQALSCFENVGPGSTMSHDDHHEGLMGIAALAHHHEQQNASVVDHVSDSDNDEDDFTSNPAANRVNELFTLLREEDSDEGEGDHVSSLPPQQHLLKIASASPAMNKQTPPESDLSTNRDMNTTSTRRKGSTTPKVRGKTSAVKRGAARARAAAASSSTSSAAGIAQSATNPSTHQEDMMEDEDFADAGALEHHDDDDYVAEHDDEDEGVVPQQRKKRGRRSVGTSPMPSGDVKFVENAEPEEISEDELMYCVVCKRSNLQVNFKKNYTINTGNYKTYCDTFPQQADQIPKPKDGESLSVCSTCYNKQWRFARGQYDPFKNRAVNKREGLKNPPKLKDGVKTSPKLESSSESSTPTLAMTTLSAEDQAAAAALSTPSKRKVKRKVGEQLDENGAEAKTEDGTTPQKKKVKRATKAKKELPPVPTPSGSTTSTAGIVTQTTPSKRGRKAKASTPVSAANGGIVSSSPASSLKKEDTISQPTLPQSSTISLCVSYSVKRAGGQEDTVYQTKMVPHKCPESVEEFKTMMMERLTQKKGDIYSFDCAYCSTTDRANNPFKVEIDDFFFNDVKLKDNDAVLVYVNEKTQQPSETPQQPQQ
ncbi:hypothetical protein C9374_008177 [Naegleria lovaniensis]|uniref:Uncharacterized protein n=1 Tax=Naegleria lovaniensis TaxID=51637 RepID=A0AA88KI59_NAELO|nr:uncharacterized protein C9374_008177 [Naegleria lovaniensis]KAG2378538.1 hypothetical protein C9374_008177 [Naegleria lovaniensis]